MKRMFTHSRRQVPGLNMAAMPDLIFTVLFFFMIASHLRSDDLKVRYQVPAGSAVEKLTHRQGVVNIYIGRPLNAQPGDTARYVIQLNDRVTDLRGLAAYIDAERRRLPAEDAERLTVSIKADRSVDMGTIADVKRVLQEAYALRINYSATER